jgi:ribosome maturation factor RimP
MQIIEQIKSWGEEFLPETVYVVEVDFKPGSKKLSVFLDSDESLTIEQCRQFNKIISEKLDELDFSEQAYILEVSSPGVDKPLKLFRQFPKHVGRELEIKLKSQTMLLGKLLAIEGEEIKILLKDPKKAYQSKTPTEKNISFSDIEETKVLVSFN